ncbi:unnamed protein product, partial [Ectocarpus sp. 12 AP-2014]
MEYPPRSTFASIPLSATTPQSMCPLPIHGPTRLRTAFVLSGDRRLVMSRACVLEKITSSAPGRVSSVVTTETMHRQIRRQKPLAKRNRGAGATHAGDHLPLSAPGPALEPLLC